MSLTIVVIFIAGGILGSVFGMVVLALGIVAQRNVSHMPEVPMINQPRQASMLGGA